MSVIEIVFAILLILSCVFIIAVVLMQESKQGMSNVISGGSSDNYFQKNSGRTKEAKLSRATKAAAVVVFIVAIAVNLISVYWGGSSDSTADNNTSISADDLELSTIDVAGSDAVVDDTPAESIAEDTAESADVTEAAETSAAAE